VGPFSGDMTTFVSQLVLCVKGVYATDLGVEAQQWWSQDPHKQVWTQVTKRAAPIQECLTMLKCYLNFMEAFCGTNKPTLLVLDEAARKLVPQGVANYTTLCTTTLSQLSTALYERQRVVRYSMEIRGVLPHTWERVKSPEESMQQAFEVQPWNAAGDEAIPEFGSGSDGDEDVVEYKHVEGGPPAYTDAAPRTPAGSPRQKHAVKTAIERARAQVDECFNSLYDTLDLHE